MYAVEIETDVKDKFIEIPEFDKFKDQHIKVIFMVDKSKQNNEFSSSQPNNKLTLFMETMKYRDQHRVIIDENINIDELANETNNDIF